MLQHRATNLPPKAFQTEICVPHTGHTMKAGLCFSAIIARLQQRGMKSP
jgi:hypothetical protein